MEYLGTELTFVYKDTSKTKKLLVSFSLSGSILCCALVLKPVPREMLKRLQNNEGSRKQQTSLYLGIYSQTWHSTLGYSDCTEVLLLEGGEEKNNSIFISVTLCVA